MAHPGTGVGAGSSAAGSPALPALVGLVAGSVVLYAAVPWAPDDPLEVARRGVVALTQASSLWAADQSGSLWLPGLQPFGQTWSLAVEWYFYLLWPVLVLLARRRGWSATGSPRLAGRGRRLLRLSLPLPTFPFYFGPTARFGELLVGAALALASRTAGSVPRRHRLGRPVLALAAIAAYALLGPDGHSPLYRYVGVPVAVVGAVVLVRSGYAGAAGQCSACSPTRGRRGRARQLQPLPVARGAVPAALRQDAPPPKPVLGPVAVVAALG